jgi:hypothetical protein
MNRRQTFAAAFAAVMLAAGPALAASPFDGAWKEVHHPTAKGITTPAGFKLTIWMEVKGDELIYYSENTTRETPYISEHVTKLDGTVAPFPNQVRFNQVSTLMTEPRELQILKMKDGDVLAGEFWTFSPDGKTAVRRGIGKSPERGSYPYQEHFVKVDDKPKFRK